MAARLLKDIPELSINRYLREDPYIGLLIHANNTLNLHLRPEFAKVTLVEGVGKSAVATIETFTSINDFIKREHTGTLYLNYERVLISDVVDRIHIRTYLPTTTWSILQQIQKASGLIFCKEDVVNQQITEDTTEIQMANTSPFWYGSLQVHVSDFESPAPIETEWHLIRREITPSEYNLADILRVQILNGLRANNIPRIQDVSTVQHLSGFEAQNIIDIDELISRKILDGLNVEGYKTDLSEFGESPIVLDGLLVEGYKTQLSRLIPDPLLDGLNEDLPLELDKVITTADLNGFVEDLPLELDIAIADTDLNGFDNAV